jgi:lipopolysaccharide transport system permease protein
MLSYAEKIWSCRYFWLSLVLIDLRMRYRRSVIGLGWSLVRPILMTMILCAVFRRLFMRQDVWTFAPYVLAGLACWDYVVNATRQGCQCFFQGESYIRQYPAPIAIYPLRTALGETVHFLIALTVVGALAWYITGTFSLPALLSLFPTVVLLFTLAWSLALIAGFANVYFQDTQHLCDVGFQIAFYATPIIYDANDLGAGRLQWLVTHCNPMLPFMQLIRDPILHAQLPPLESYATAGVIVLVVACLAMLTCSRQQRYLVHHL